MLLYGPISTLLFGLSPRIRHMPLTWVVDSGAMLGFILASGDWRSPFYLLWLSTLALPATSLPLRQAPWLALGGPARVPRRRVPRRPGAGRAAGRATETLAIHLSLPFLLVVLTRLRRGRAAPPGRRAQRARAPGDRGRAPAHRLGAARLGQAAPARRAPARQLAAGPRRGPRWSRPSAAPRRARVGRLGHGHEPRRAALAAGGAPARRGAARAGGRARARPGTGDRGPRQRAAAAAAGRGARLPHRLRGDHQRAAPRRRHGDRRELQSDDGQRFTCASTDDGRGLPDGAERHGTGLAHGEPRRHDRRARRPGRRTGWTRNRRPARRPAQPKTEVRQ